MQLKTEQNFETFIQFMRMMKALAFEQDIIRIEKTVSSLHIAMKINKIKNYVNEHFPKKLSITEVARVAGISPRNLLRVFKLNVGLNFVDYVNTIRVEHACFLLRKSKDTIAAIAYSCGFSTPAYFNEVFRRHKGVTPGEFKRVMNYEL